MYPVIVFDLETTGFSHSKDCILSIGAVAVELVKNKPEITDSFYSLVKPDPVYLEDGRADKAMSVNKITIEMLETAPDNPTVAKDFQDWLKKAKPAIITSYNLVFDKGFLKKFTDCNELKWGKCLMREFARIHKLKRWVSLDKAIWRYHILLKDTDELHNAKTDAKLAAELMIQMEG